MPQTSPELDRIERFIAAYNSIDDFLQAQIGTGQTFRSAVDWFAKRNGWWRDAETLRVFATLRNFLIHEKTRPYDYPCAPSQGAVEEIEAIRDHLLNPRRALPVFAREVVTLKPQTEVRHALQLIAEREHGRFPIYEGRQFRGLLTEAGLARWVAAQVAENRDLDWSTPISEVLPRETKRRNFRFVSPRELAEQIAWAFHENTFLEAVLISDNGQEDGNLRGIVTRRDVAAL